ncbi:tRNA (adenosine(37)-N6)-threonylcarbamoyltransferase complex ATPase subunit type 1 TsaE [Desulfovibrio ferrophilus]|uniref:tRNA threonylcarbamoyladenosine biosynthesis protein TsaE n=1 Tax=Desulfovibrio ferrophilus TaxID=241368 RepID=A0A2Z6AWN0_9BACT|nr:tRNA (adenosine(37)-N6)-threonylcarbamoyltransferase complex ATPase subunit type 1 TsaE [Desulfovibrio ferrophilus]BBD07608.1 uncharacterized protein DFE_0882 [Desulfovibrio ferrophilus]
MSNALAIVEIRLPDEGATLDFGAKLARALTGSEPEQVLLFSGDLGAGKTTLVRGLVSALPGGDEARVSSPSFNIMNMYPTDPETAHFDLYRLEGFPADDSLLEHMQDDRSLVLVEWAQFLQKEDWPEEYLLLEWQPAESGRTILLTAKGKKAKQTLLALA